MSQPSRAERIAYAATLAVFLLVSIGVAFYGWETTRPNSPKKLDSSLGKSGARIGLELEAARYGFPSLGTPLDRGEYWIAFDAKRMDPLWSLEVLHGPVKSVPRAGSFREDSKLPAALQVSAADYRNSGFDIGHLTPAEDRGAKMAATFIFSNACPQNPAMNRGLWARIEATTRASVADREVAWIVTCPVFSAHPKTIGPDHVAVPADFAKSELLVRAGKPISITDWEVPNVDPPAGSHPADYVVGEAKLENDCGFTLWPKLSVAKKETLQARK